MEKIDESAPALLTWDCLFTILLHCEIETVMRVSATCSISSSLVAAPLSNAGDICVYTVVETHIVADIVGYMV
jgi:hypothetical protein